MQEQKPDFFSTTLDIVTPLFEQTEGFKVVHDKGELKIMTKVDVTEKFKI